MKTKQFKVPENTTVQITQEDNRVVIKFVPEKVEFKPKDGDFICNEYWVLIVKRYDKFIESHAEICLDNKVFRRSEISTYNPEFTRFATDSEKQELIDTLAEKGLKWNAEEKRIEKIRWRAKRGEHYIFAGSHGDTDRGDETGSTLDLERYNTGNYFRTENQAKEAAKLVKETLLKFQESL